MRRRVRRDVEAAPPGGFAEGGSLRERRLVGGTTVAGAAIISNREHLDVCNEIEVSEWFGRY
jgi:hypothetical protein